MRTCFQFQELDVLQHGEAVAYWFEDLYWHLVEGRALSEAWRLPSWLSSENCDALMGLLPSLPQLALYQRYHDCGKPFCRQVDSQGWQHFPNHAEVSYQRWLECGGDESTGQLIRLDMDVHLLKAEGLAEFSQRPQAFALLLSAVAEVHANAQMFGGTDSESFKIKLKHLERRGKQIVALLKENMEK